MVIRDFFLEESIYTETILVKSSSKIIFPNFYKKIVKFGKLDFSK